MPNGLMNFETTNTSSIPGPRAIIITQIPCKALYVPWGKTNRCARSSQMNYMNRTHIVDMPAISLLLHTKKPGLKKKTLAGRCLRPTGHRKKIYSFAMNPRRPSSNKLVLLDAAQFPWCFLRLCCYLSRKPSSRQGTDKNLSPRRLVPFKLPSKRIHYQLTH